MDGRRARIVLGVGTDAGPAEVKRAFRARALLAHPDRGGSRDAFDELVAAVGTLVAEGSAGSVAPRAARSFPAPLAAARPRFDAYDSPRRPQPRRTFADALEAALAAAG
ncbi:MAG TPA: DnaJ domain-containing protein [Acidimicrobiia bacterium]|nr:DnaJ domain-containing protein [Acidimicrobiia bacterium]